MMKIFKRRQNPISRQAISFHQFKAPYHALTAHERYVVDYVYQCVSRPRRRIT